MPRPEDNAVIDQPAVPVPSDEDAREEIQDAPGTEQEEQVETAEQAIDWKARAEESQKKADEFEKNFKGLQSTVQQLVESQRQTSAQRAQQDEANLKRQFEAQLEGLTENEAAFAKRAFDLELENRRLKSQYAENEPINQRLARDAILNKLSKDHGVSLEFLEQMVQKYNHPLAVAAAAEAAHATRKQLERPKSNSRVEASTGGGTGGDIAELEALANSGDWDAYWRITDQQAEREARRR